MTRNKGKHILSLSSVAIIMAVSWAAHAHAEDQADDLLFLKPHVVMPSDTEAGSNTPPSKAGMFLDVEEVTNGSTSVTRNKEKDFVSRYDSYSVESSWKTSLKDALHSFGLLQESTSTNSLSWLGQINAIKNTFLIMLHTSLSGELRTIPVVTLVATSNVTATSAHIVWKSSIPGFSRVYYGSSSPVVISTTTASITTWGMTDHDVTINGLLPGTIYYFRIVAFNIRGDATTSQEASFTTLQNELIK